MWAEKIQNLQVRRIQGNDLEYLNLNLTLHLAQYFQILLEGVFEFELTLSGPDEADEADEADEDDFESYELYINYTGNNIEKPFDVNHLMFWMQMTLYKELIQERNNTQNDEDLNNLNEVIDLFHDIKDSDSFDRLIDSIAMNVFYKL